MQSKASSQDFLIQSKLVRQLVVIHLNSAAAVLGQTVFLLCLLADKVSDRLWLWFSFCLHAQRSVKLLQPTQGLPSTGESVPAINSPFEQHLGCRFVSGAQPPTFCSNLLPDCRQLWIVHIKCMRWIYPALFSSAEGTLPPACCCLWCHHGAAKPTSIPALWQVCSALALEKKV